MIDTYRVGDSLLSEVSFKQGSTELSAAVVGRRVLITAEKNVGLYTPNVRVDISIEGEIAIALGRALQELGVKASRWSLV